MAEEQEENVVPDDSAENDDTYKQSKPKQKLIRILTVLAYILSVSMAAILLSIYYVFMWNGQPTLARRTDPSMQHRIGLEDYDYHSIHKEDIGNISRNNYERDDYRQVSKKNLKDIENSIENFTSNSIHEAGIESDEQNVTNNEPQVSGIDAVTFENAQNSADPITADASIDSQDNRKESKQSCPNSKNMREH